MTPEQEQRQEQQVQQIQKAYFNVKNIGTKINQETIAEIKVDGIDQAYVWFRTFIPSWLMGVIFLAGLCVMVPLMIKKIFGVEINFNVIKTRKKKEAPDA